MSRNFDFIQKITDDEFVKICSELYETCVNAEEFVYTKPKLSIDQDRIAAELMAKLYYSKHVGDYSGMSFARIINDESFKNALFENNDRGKANEINNAFHRLRKKGNPTHHGDVTENPITTSIGNLEALHSIISTVISELYPDIEVPKFKEIPLSFATNSSAQMQPEQSDIFGDRDDKRDENNKPAEFKGTANLKKDYDKKTGEPFVLLKNVKANAEGPFLLRWGVKDKNGEITYIRPKQSEEPLAGDNFFNKRHVIKNKKTNIGKKIVCKITHSSYSRGEIICESDTLEKKDLLPEIRGTATIDADPENDSTLKVSFFNTNIEEKPFYAWSIDGSDFSEPKKDSRYEITEADIGKTIICRVSLEPKYLSFIESNEFIVKSEHLVSNKATISVAEPEWSTESEVKPEAEPIKISEPAIIPDTEPVAESEPPVEPEAIVEAEPVVEAKIEAQLQKETNPKKSHLLFEPAEARDYEARRYFQSLQGQVQYFACKYDDYYVLNTFEKVDYSHFIYRFLKEQGFVRVIIAEEDNAKYEFFAFDKLSALSFANPGEFKRIENVNDFDSLQIFYDNACKGGSSITPPKNARRIGTINSKGEGNHFSKHNVAEYGKRRINIPTTNNEDIFHANAIHYISPALEATNAKTCIVLPIELLVSNKYLSNQIVSYIKTSFKGKINENVLLITTSSTDDFIAKIEKSYSLFEELEVDINKTIARLDNGERFGTNLVKRLKSEGRILMADSLPDTDEIANLLLRKKIIEQSPLFHDIRYSKIYSIASFIRHSDEFINSVTKIRRISEGKTELSIKKLEILFNDRNIVDYLATKSKDLYERQPVKYNNLPASYVSRVVGDVQRSIISQAEKDEELNAILLEMDELVGMEKVKIQVLEQMDLMEDDLIRLSEGKIKELPHQNMMFVGPQGTGKTTVAQLVARLMCAKGILPKGTVVKRTPAYYTDTSAVGNLKDAIQADIESAAGGVILFDEFYNFNQGHSAGNMANDALAAIMDGADKYKGRICIIIAGYEKQVMETLAFNPGAERRFPNRIDFTSYSTQDIVEIFRRQVVASGFKEPDESVLRAIEPIIDAEIADKRERFTNAGFVTDTLFPAIRRKYVGRKVKDYVIKVGDVIKAYPSFKELIMNPGNAVDDILAEFDALVGMEGVKRQIIEQMEVMKFDLNEYRNGKTGELPHQNMMFVGPQGIGKTTVATLVARLFAASGILPKRTPIKRTPAYYTNTSAVGNLKDAIQADIDSAEGGVILFDEFYNFNQGHSAGNMANDALAAIMDGADKYKGRICIIIAGYEKQVMETLAFNPGAERRFPNRIDFTSYSTQDIVEIFRRQVVASGFKEPDESVLRAIEPIIDAEKAEKRERFTNAGFVTDTLFPAIRRKYVMRKVTDYIITVEDVREAFPVTADDLNKRTELIKRDRPSKEKFTNLDEPFGGVISGDSKKIQKLDRNAVIRINTDAVRVGTGFFIHPDGYAITCNHVICDAAGSEAKDITARVYCYDGDDIFEIDIPAKIVYRDQHIDMALLQVDIDSEEYKEFIESHYNGNLPYLAMMSESDKIKDMTGDAAVLMGFPNAKKSIQTGDASISGRTVNPVGIECYATMHNAYGGNSGGPIIAVESGLVIGILTGSVKDKTTGKGTEGDNYILPINYFWKDMVK